ncbi:hypothetical protein Dimus_025725 [Dionaea muscipula]
MKDDELMEVLKMAEYIVDGDAKKVVDDDVLGGMKLKIRGGNVDDGWDVHGNQPVSDDDLVARNSSWTGSKLSNKQAYKSRSEPGPVSIDIRTRPEPFYFTWGGAPIHLFYWKIRTWPGV